MMPMPTDLMIRLKDTFATQFSEDELKEFALALGVDYENLSGSSKSGKARELALYLWRHSKLPLLAEVGPKRRPDIDWGSILDTYAPTAAPPGGNPGTVDDKLSHLEMQKLVPILANHAMFQTPDGRNTVLVLAGVNTLINQDLNGNAQYVASSLLVKLNDYGQTGQGDTAIGRLLVYVAADPTLPPAQRQVIADIAANHAINLG